MIVTSKRCYLNILTQIMTKDQLLEAQYYIADLTDGSLGGSKNNSSNISGVTQDEDGNYVPVQQNQTQDPRFKMSKFDITYGDGSLSPTVFQTTFSLRGETEAVPNPVGRFVNHINNTPEVYLRLYRDLVQRSEPDKLQIMIFYDEETVKHYVHHVCELLSNSFGFDIIFIDPQYRQVDGRVNYVGNKVRAEQVIHEVRDFSLLKAFEAADCQTSDIASKSNLTSYLCGFETCEDLIYLYNLLWPEDPLPAGNYILEDLREIIIRKRLSTRKRAYDQFDNLNVIDDWINRIQSEG